MKAVGIICEYNPFHNGHLYHIERIKSMYKDYTIVLVLGGYFLERGDVSLISKWNKAEIALKYGVDLVLELPTLYNTNSGDFFAYHAVKMLDALSIEYLVFGSECDDIELLKKAAKVQALNDFNDKVKEHLASGYNYPTSLSKSLGIDLQSNDLLGVSYIKAIDKLNSSIIPVCIKRTNDFLDTQGDDKIISAQNIREKLSNNIDITKFIPEYDLSMINHVDYDRLFNLIKYKIITDKSLYRYLGVDEGLENRLKKAILTASNLDDLITKVKSKRYTYLRIKRMLIHILLGIEKDDMNINENRIRILGFSIRGQKYLRNFDNENLVYKIDSRVGEIEKIAANIYYDITGDESVKREFLNKPIQ